MKTLSEQQTNRIRTALYDLAQACYTVSLSTGVWDQCFIVSDSGESLFRPKTRNVGEQFAQMHSALSKALEASQNKVTADPELPQFNGMTAGLARSIVCILETCGALELPIEEALIAVIRNNEGTGDGRRKGLV